MSCCAEVKGHCSQLHTAALRLSTPFDAILYAIFYFWKKKMHTGYSALDLKTWNGGF